MKAYRTIKEIDDKIETLYEIQKSKFITHLRHVDNEEEARAFVTAIKKRYYDARHNCSAYILGEDSGRQLQKSNDDGEPGGTAGAPILEAVKQNGLTDIVVVVTRYFGGIKLGAGGLIRAYSHAATLGLNAAVKLEMQPFQEISITLDYSLQPAIEHWLRANSIRTSETIYAETVTLPLLLPPDEVETRLKEITDLTAANFTQEKGRLLRLPIEIKT